MRIIRLLSMSAFLLGIFSFSSALHAQGGGGGGGFGGGGGNTGGGGFGGTGGTTGGGGFGGTGGTTGGGGFGGTGGTTGGGNTTFGGTTGGGTSSFGGGTTGSTGQGASSGSTGGGASNSSQPLNLNNQLNITPTTPTAVDLRNQGFIGPNAQQIINQGYVGAATQLSGGKPASGLFFGGGVNTQGSSGGVGGAQGLRATGATGGLGRNTMGGFGTTTTAGVRRNVRNRMVNQVQVNRVAPAEVAQRFSTRLDRIPLAANAGSGVKIDLENGTAVLTGTVPSTEAANRIERQLRLEPGVYKIENRLEVNR